MPIPWNDASPKEIVAMSLGMKWPIEDYHLLPAARKSYMIVIAAVTGAMISILVLVRHKYCSCNVIFKYLRRYNNVVGSFEDSSKNIWLIRRLRCVMLNALRICSAKSCCNTKSWAWPQMKMSQINWRRPRMRAISRINALLPGRSHPSSIINLIIFSQRRGESSTIIVRELGKYPRRVQIYL